MGEDYTLFLFGDEPVFESSPVMKITHYPFEPESYKPFAQAQLVAVPGGITARLWAFEARPEAVSTLALALKGPNGVVYTLSVTLSGDAAAALDGLPCAPPHIHPFAGEDLQGEYWGVLFTLGGDILGRLDIEVPTDGLLLHGNVYKLCDGRRPHFGAFAPVSARDPSLCSARIRVMRY